MEGLDFSVVPPYADLILMGALWTAVLTVAAAAVSFAGGICFAVATM